MFFSLLRAAKPRQDRRPLYRRIFTNRRLDIAHKVVVRGMIGFILFSASQTVNSAMIGLVQKTFSIIAQSYTYIFLLGASAGAGFELFKINFSVNGVNYYTVFKDRQLKKELKKFEDDLKNTEEEIRMFVQQQKASVFSS
ncbi:hypothetical protein M3Y96_00864600 [Aphelenchoides besseyi]|nr:hypothetical protein M3Y96_00864600 [Aphelenchoides besseyi]